VNFQHPIDRRRFVQGAGLTLAASSPFVLAACGGDPTPSEDIDEANDLKYVQEAQSMEWGMVAAYKKILTFLTPAEKKVGQKILAQETSHATGLRTVITDLGGTPVHPNSDAEYAHALGFDRVGDRTSALAFATQLEQQAIASYLVAIPKLTIGDLRATWTSLVTSEAEHGSVITGFGKPGDLDAQSPAPLIIGAKR
jgi:ferritin-like protein